MEMGENVDDRFIFKYLVRMLKNIDQYDEVDIPEVKFLEDFPPPSVILPEANFSPRVIIEHMKNRHEHIKHMIEEELIPLEPYLYRYKHDERIDCYNFTNNMSLFHDIFLICFLSNLILAIENENSEFKIYIENLIQNISQIMINKYQIQPNDMTPAHQNAITVIGIAYCFPSITFSLYGSDIENQTPTTDLKRLSAIFHFRITKMLCSPMFPSIIPRLNRNKHSPLAFFIALSITTDKLFTLKTRNYTYTSLKEIYKSIHRLYYSDAFPQSLKLQLCKNLGIVFVKNDEDTYASFFKDCRKTAFSIITMSHFYDPRLKRILSKLE